MTDADGETETRSESTADTFFPEGTFNDWIGLEVEDIDDGKVILSVEFEPFKQNPGGVLHGGVTATLIDVAAGMAIGSATDGTADVRATTNLDIQFLRPITDTAYATAEVIRIGTSNAVARVEVESTAPEGERKLVATGTATYQRG